MTIHEEFEVGNDLDRALRAAVTGLAQIMERNARRRADTDRTEASRARQEWLGQRDDARRQYLPWMRPDAVERGQARHGARAWAAAAAWATMDPLAKAAERELAERIQETHGAHPSTLLQKAAETPALSDQPPAKRLLTMPEARELAEAHAPHYYTRHAGLSPQGDLPGTDAEKRFHEDWQHFAEQGELPERSRWEAWADHSGQGEQFALNQWMTPDGDVDHDSRDAALIRAWDEGSDDRALRELEDHQGAMAAAGMSDLRAQVTTTDQPSWVPLMDRVAFEEAPHTDAVQAWRDARAQGATGDIAAQAAAAQLAEQVRQKYGVDPNSYLLEAMTDRSANQVEGRRAAEDRARKATEEALAVTGLASPGEAIALTAATSSAPGTVTRDRVLELNNQAQDYFATQLRPGSAGQQYLVGRLGEDVMQGPWALGYAPPGWTRLTNHLHRQGATDAEILEAGLGRLSSKGNVIDAFRDRVMVGVRSPDGELVGFVGRDLSGDERAPKYLNTGATPAFTKGEQVFGLTEAAEGAALVRTEGAFDAIATSLAGEGRAVGVAPLGTAMSDAQAALIADKATDGRVWLANDNDAGGQAATEADYFKLARSDVEARALPLPGGDPAAVWETAPLLLRETLEHLDEAPSAAEVVVDRFLTSHQDQLASGDADTHRDLGDTVDRVLGHMGDPLERELLLARVDAAREDLIRRSDVAREDAVTLDVASEQLGVAARTSTDQDRSAMEAGDVEAIEDRADARDAAGDRLEAAAADVTTPAAQAAYDRAAESNLADLDPEARSARVASSHGFSRPTGDMVRGAATRGKGQAARPDRTVNAKRGRGRGLSR